MENRYRFLTYVVIALVCCSGLLGCTATPSREVTAAEMTTRLAARDALYRAVGNADGAVRAQAIESLAHTEKAAAGEAMILGLDDAAVAVRFVAAMGIGDVRYRPARAKLQAMLAEPIDENVLCGVVYALYRLGDSSYMSHLGRLLYSRQPEVRANAALVMGRMGMAPAIRPLRSREEIERDDGVRLQLIESLAMLGDPRSFSMLKTYARVGQPHERMAAVEALGRTRREAAKGTFLWAIEKGPPPLRLAAARALARQGDTRGYDLAEEAIIDPVEYTQQSYDEPVSVSLAQQQQMQSLGALAIGSMGNRDAVAILAPLLRSPNGLVVVSAARSIMMLSKPTDAIAGAVAAVVEAPPTEAAVEMPSPAMDRSGGAILMTAPPKE